MSHVCSKDCLEESAMYHWLVFKWITGDSKMKLKWDFSLAYSTKNQLGGSVLTASRSLHPESYCKMPEACVTGTRINIPCYLLAIVLHFSQEAHTSLWLLLFTMVCSLSSLPTGYWSVSWAPPFTPNLIFSSIIFIVTSLPSASRDSFGSLEEMQHMAPFLPQGFSVAFTRCLKQWKYYYSHPLLFNHWDNKH